MNALIERLRRARWANLFVVILRILIGYAFVPAGLKKVLGQPFTDPNNVGAFHDFLDAFLATGPFYRFVGIVQLIIAILLMTQRFALLGSLMALPVLSAITVFCWATAGIPTTTVVTLMLLGTIGLALWDKHRWWAVIDRSALPTALDGDKTDRPINERLWAGCGAAILVFYFATCAIDGGVYRPKGADWGNPAFYALPLIALFPVVTWLLERRSLGATRASEQAATDQ